jgi:hypothetical protein
MTPDIAVSFATFLIVFLVLNRLGGARRPEPGPDPEIVQARALIGTKIDEQIEALAERYLQAHGQDMGADHAASRFARHIEAFIGDVLLRDIELEQPGLGRAMREVVTLERERVYDLVQSRVEAHLIERGMT